jgi:uncharacterized protein (DUF433 family)
LKLTQHVPLTEDSDGVFRLTGSRVTLDSIVHQFKSGATGEQSQEDFPSLALSDIYAVIAYYLQHPSEVDDYLRGQTDLAKEVKEQIENSSPTRELRERLRLRRARAAA